jgi:hypothetical protein
MYFLCLAALIVGLMAVELICRYRGLWQEARDKLRTSRQGTRLALRCAEDFKQLLTDRDRLHAIETSCLSEQLSEQARQHDQHNMVLLDEIGGSVLEKVLANTIADAWKSYALGYEVLCETAAEKDAIGANNASAAIAEARRVLMALGQYDA